jgi:hypothetical protein
VASPTSSVAANGSATVSATCATGLYCTGGGCKVTAVSGLVQESRSVSDTSWQCVMKSGDATVTSVQAFAICSVVRP